MHVPGSKKADAQLACAAKIFSMCGRMDLAMRFAGPIWNVPVLMGDPGKIVVEGKPKKKNQLSQNKVVEVEKA